MCDAACSTAMLRDLELKQAYHKPEDDIASEFYLPCLAEASRYDRAVGFFSSAIYVLAWPSLKCFVEKGGKIRLICSPVLSAADSDAVIAGYSAKLDSEQTAIIASEFSRMLSSSSSAKPAKVLSTLVALGVVDFRIAWIKGGGGGKVQRLFHDKLGIFTDSRDDVVAFKGSMNETWAGLSLDGNLESVDVFLSWSGDRERERVADEQSYFTRLWDDAFPGVDVRPFSKITIAELASSADIAHWEDLVDEICIELSASEKWAMTDARKPRPHQTSALEKWEEQGRRGILKHATGSGKTFTALCAVESAMEKGEVPLILVPSDLLRKQWTEELRNRFGPDLKLLVCGGGNTAWRTQQDLRRWTRESATVSNRAVLSTILTASSSSFIDLCSSGSHLFMVADEVHRLGALSAQKILELETGPRLGLSATPERAGDPDGTEAIFRYFGGIVPPPFTLQDAIAAGALTPYSYHIHRATLDQEEEERWSKLSNEIRVLYARLEASEREDASLRNKIRQKLIDRARIVKKAQMKPSVALRVVVNTYKRGSRWIVYCDDQEQLNDVLILLRSKIGNEVYEYHSAMSGDKAQTLALFHRSGGIVVSIRCLDEGIDIPSVDTALILASSKNPREYVQRRGRVLRKYEGKSVATIHDVLVTPTIVPDDPPNIAIVEGEIARAIEFGHSAINPGCVADLENLCIEYGLDFSSLSAAGVEDDEEDMDI